MRPGLTVPAVSLTGQPTHHGGEDACRPLVPLSCAANSDDVCVVYATRPTNPNGRAIQNSIDTFGCHVG